MARQSKDELIMQFMTEKFNDLKSDFKDAVMEIKKDNKEDHKELGEKLEQTMMSLVAIKGKYETLAEKQKNDINEINKKSKEALEDVNIKATSRRDWVAIAIATLSLVGMIFLGLI